MDCTDNLEALWTFFIILYVVGSWVVKGIRAANRKKAQQQYQPTKAPTSAAPPQRSESPARKEIDLAFLENAFEQLGNEGPLKVRQGPSGEMWIEHDTSTPYDEVHASGHPAAGDGDEDADDPNFEHHGDTWHERDDCDPNLERHGDTWHERDDYDVNSEHTPGHEAEVQWNETTPKVAHRRSTEKVAQAKIDTGTIVDAVLLGGMMAPRRR